MSSIFTVNKEDFKKAGIKFVLVLIGSVATYMESFIPGFLAQIVASPLLLPILLAANTSVVDLVRKFITDEEGKLGGVIQL